MQWPLKVEFSDPKSVGLEGARNFYLHTDQQVKIGLWWVIMEIYDIFDLENYSLLIL